MSRADLACCGVIGCELYEQTCGAFQGAPGRQKRHTRGIELSGPNGSTVTLLKMRVFVRDDRREPDRVSSRPSPGYWGDLSSEPSIGGLCAWRPWQINAYAS